MRKGFGIAKCVRRMRRRSASFAQVKRPPGQTSTVTMGICSCIWRYLAIMDKGWKAGCKVFCFRQCKELSLASVGVGELETALSNAGAETRLNVHSTAVTTPTARERSSTQLLMNFWLKGFVAYAMAQPRPNYACWMCASITVSQSDGARPS